MAETFQINLLCCVATIKQEIDAGFPQIEIAKTYAMAMKSDSQKAEVVDWAAINGAILAKWKMSGLNRVKKQAWKILAGTA